MYGLINTIASLLMIATVVALIRPRLLRLKNRKQAALIGIGSIIAYFVLADFFMPDEMRQQQEARMAEEKAKRARQDSVKAALARLNEEKEKARKDSLDYFVTPVPHTKHPRAHYDSLARVWGETAEHLISQDSLLGVWYAMDSKKPTQAINGFIKSKEYVKYAMSPVVVDDMPWGSDVVDHGATMDKKNLDIIEMYAYQYHIEFAYLGTKLRKQVTIRLNYSNKNAEWSLKYMNIPGFVNVK